MAAAMASLDSGLRPIKRHSSSRPSSNKSVSGWLVFTAAGALVALLLSDF